MSDAQTALAADPATKQPDQKAALTPPTSEDMDRGKREGSSSELSELELDDDEDIGDIEPDHYWDGGKIPVFKPVRCVRPADLGTAAAAARFNGRCLCARSAQPRLGVQCVADWCVADHGPIPEL